MGSPDAAMSGLLFCYWLLVTGYWLLEVIVRKSPIGKEALLRLIAQVTSNK
jgi:hypothetical protein